MLTAKVEPSVVASQHLNLSQSQIKQGLPYQTFESLLSSLQLSTTRLAGAIGISPHTLRRRRKDGRFSFVESDRLARFINLYQHSASALESEAAAGWRETISVSMDWLRWSTLPQNQVIKNC